LDFSKRKQLKYVLKQQELRLFENSCVLESYVEHPLKKIGIIPRVRSKGVHRDGGEGRRKARCKQARST